MAQSVPTHRPSWIGAPTERHRQYNKTARNQESKKFYHSRAWLRLRDIKLCNAPYCEDCLSRGIHTAATHVHHMQELTTHPHLALDEDNIMSMCISCHSRVHASKTIGAS